jgi:hypothetical protein
MVREIGRRLTPMEADSANTRMSIDSLDTVQSCAKSLILLNLRFSPARCAGRRSGEKCFAFHRKPL